jgi:hypothetical protein
MTSNDNNDKCKIEEEVESLTVRKRLWLSDDNGGDDDASDLPEEHYNSFDSPKEEEETE